jgi:hypothetical protein
MSAEGAIQCSWMFHNALRAVELSESRFQRSRSRDSIFWGDAPGLN